MGKTNTTGEGAEEEFGGSEPATTGEYFAHESQ